MRPRSERAGFTLAEVAVTIVIVGIGLVLVVEGLMQAKLSAANTRNYKLARELAVLTMGRIESGLFQEDIENGLAGSYAEEGYPEFVYEVLVGEESFRPAAADAPFDSWNPPERLGQEQDEEEEEEQPYEKVKIRITYPKVQDMSNELVLERWIPWKQVYGEAETAPAEAPK